MGTVAITKFRTARGLTQQSFAKALGVTQGMVGHWEAGRHGVSAEMAVRIEQVFGIRRSELRPDLWPGGRRKARAMQVHI